MKEIITCLIFIVGPGLLFGQKKFEVTFVLPDSAHAHDMKFYYYRLKGGYKSIPGEVHGNKVTISGDYHSVYANILAAFETGDQWSSKPIYTTEKPATVTLAAPFNEKDPFADCKVVNGLELLNDDTIWDLYQVKWYPTFFVIDKKGNLVYAAIDLLDNDLDKLKKVLAENAGT
ncbi:hypothetical protein [Chitinophaga sp.]|uniref:hypothetical protein n=1 Tax=Chitinophaga sp. TaxID=1869181 RepID=UPI0031D13EE6